MVVGFVSALDFSNIGGSPGLVLLFNKLINQFGTIIAYIVGERDDCPEFNEY